MKNANTKTVKKSKKSNKKVVAKIQATPAVENPVETPVAQAAPVENKTSQNQIQVEVTTPVVASPIVATMKKRGRHKGQLTYSLVSLQDLVNAIPSMNVKLPLSNKFIRSLGTLGVNIKSTLFQASNNNVAEITKTFKPVSQTALVVDLNKETVAA